MSETDRRPKRRRNHHHHPSGKRSRSNHHQSGAVSPLAIPTRQVQAPPLGPSLPPLQITYTADEKVAAEWLAEHVTTTVAAVADDTNDTEKNDDDDNKNKNNDDNKDNPQNNHHPPPCVLGLDTETKPCFTKEQARASLGPDVLQLAVCDGHCLVLQLSLMTTLCLAKKSTPDQGPLAAVLANPAVLKAGVNIDQDVIELHQRYRLDTAGRLDLRSLVERDEPQSLKAIAERLVPGLVLPKIKRFQMSNWAQAPLNNDQIRYAAADAFCGAVAAASMLSSSTTNNLVDSRTTIELVRARQEQQAERHRLKLERRQAQQGERNERTQEKRKARNAARQQRYRQRQRERKATDRPS